MGANIITGCDVAAILRCVAIACETPPAWRTPPEYLVPTVSETVLRIVVGALPPGIQAAF